MNIFFDHQTFSQQKYGGVSRYICELINGVNETGNKAHLSLLCSNNVHLKEYGLDTFSYPFDKRLRLLYKSNQLFNIVDMSLRNFDLYHATYFDPFFLRHIRNKPYAVTFHDMTYERLSVEYPELATDKTVVLHKKEIIKRAAAIIAVSESTKRDVVDILGISADKITVIPLANSISMNSSTIKVDKYANEQFLLYVGNRQLYKNFLPFISSITELIKEYEICVYCAGGGQFTNTERAFFKKSNIEDSVKHIPIDNASLASLYSSAIAFVFPSLYEGFGIPILEAMTNGCPCILSDSSSLPEVGGDAAIYMDARSRESMSSTVKKVLDDKIMRDLMAGKGLTQAAKFSWDTTVRSTVKLYTSVI